jgi:hypothetical protein
LDQNGAAVDLPGAKTEVYAVNIKMTETREINQAIEDMKRTGLIETCQRESGSMATERSIGIDPGSKLRVAMPEPQKITLKSMACAIAEGARGVKKFLLEASLKAITNISDYNKVNRTLCEAHRIIGKIKVKDLENTKNIQDKALAPLIRQTRYDKTAILLEMDSYNADGKYGTTVGRPETAYLKFDNGIVTIQWAGREEPATPEMAANAFVEYYQRHQYELADNTKQRHFVATKGINSYTNKEIGITARTGGTLGDLGALIEEAGKKAKNRTENRTQPEANRGNKTPGDERT